MAVTIPVTLIFVDRKLATVDTPEEFNCPTKVLAVTIPVTLIFVDRKSATVEIPEELMLPSTFPDTLPVTLPVTFPSNAPTTFPEKPPLEVVTPVTFIPFGFTFRTDEPVETIVTCPYDGEKIPVEVSVVKPILGAFTVFGERIILSILLRTLMLNGAASIQNEDDPTPSAISS